MEEDVGMSKLACFLGFDIPTSSSIFIENVFYYSCITFKNAKGLRYNYITVRRQTKHAYEQCHLKNKVGKGKRYMNPHSPFNYTLRLFLKCYHVSIAYSKNTGIYGMLAKCSCVVSICQHHSFYRCYIPFLSACINSMAFQKSYLSGPLLERSKQHPQQYFGCHSVIHSFFLSFCPHFFYLIVDLKTSQSRERSLSRSH